MAIFSSSTSTSNTRRGGWAQSLLPTSTSTTTSSPRSSKSRKRRRTTIQAFILSNFFTIGLSISLLIFLVLLFRYGIPNPLSSNSKKRHSYSYFHRPRKPSNRRPPSNGSAVVDITTKDLYDRIEFKDVDGGPWKQGWRVEYKGDEWDGEKLKVFVVPHSHNDPGWKLTVDEYYDQQSRHILDTIVQSLSKDARRKFIWEEMSYLEKWWRDASEDNQLAFINLVKNGQLEIVGGGWVMNDEANSHYFAILEQITEGNMWLNETVGVVPKNAWAIDPFGYSPTMAYLLRRMGFENMLIQRTHYELKKDLAKNKNLEYIWRQSWDVDESTDIFVHMMPFYSYDIPHTCGPEPAICCQFDFARMRGGSSYELCPWRQDPVETTPDNVQERAMKLLDQYKKKSTLYRTNTLLVPLGDDFRYMNTDEAEAQFRNYQLLFDYINSNSHLNTEAKFGTLDDYFEALREESDRVNYTQPGEVGSVQVSGFPSLSGDFFTYADRNQDYWSGYYVSRPFFKAVDRVLEQTLRGSEMMITLLLGYCHKTACEKFPTSFTHKLTAARRNLALFQHHDGVTGTAKNHVVEDYGVRMHTSLQDLQIFMSKAVEVLLGYPENKDPSLFGPEQVRSKYDVQPVHRAINTPEGSAHSVVFFNPLEQTRDEIVMVIVNKADMTVLDSNWSCVESQVSPEFQHEKGKILTGKHRLYWQASVPALGLQTYYIVHGFPKCEKAKPATLRFVSDSNLLDCPTPYACSRLEGDVAEIKNQHQTLSFNLKFGLLHKITQKNGISTIVGEELGMYSSSESGAYLFKPDGEATSIVQGGGQIVISEGPLMQEFYSYPKTAWDKSPISHSTRIYNGVNTVQEFVIEKEYHVELLGNDFNDRELIVRYKTDLENGRVFYSDLNGFQTSRRETYDKIPLQGNYYPMPSLAFMQSLNGERFSVHSKQSLGSASLKNGWLEIMLDRRLVRDDGRGLGQGVMDNRPMNIVFHILKESNISAGVTPISANVPLNPSLLSHRVGGHLNYPIHAFVSKNPQEIKTLTLQPSPPRSLSPLTSSLPCDLHIVSLKVPRLVKYSVQPVAEEPRFVLILQRQQWDSSYCRKGRTNCSSIANEGVNFSSMFKDLEVSNARATSLNLLHDDTEMLGYDERFGDGAPEGHVAISPMELQAYKFELRPRQ
ncbi:mannosyl-oligosaccharide 1,3-1,6-alpha-mannosidase [Ranunculus cassubicifolius]